MLQGIGGIDLVAEHVVDMGRVDVLCRGVGANSIDHLLSALRVVDLAARSVLGGRDGIGCLQALRGGANPTARARIRVEKGSALWGWNVPMS